MRTIKKLGLIILLFVYAQITLANTSSLIQAHFIQWAKKNNIVGAALAVDNKTYFYGYSNKELTKPVTAKTRFGIGSITKTFISVILLKLEAKGKLNIYDSVAKYLPQYSKLKYVTIQSLMQMTAGFNDVKIGGGAVSPLQQVKASYRNYNPKLAGTWQYSNASYQLLGMLIEKITRKSLAAILATDITLPLHLYSIHFPNKTEALSLKEYQNGKTKTTNFYSNGAAGGLVSNARDLEKFIRHLFVKKDLLPTKQYNELVSFVTTPKQYYEFTGTKEPKFGLAVFKWDISPYGNVLSYPGVLKEGFASTYTVIGEHIIISQTNTYNKNDFTLLWPYRDFTKKRIKHLVTQGAADMS